jgi:hypothetical protein
MKEDYETYAGVRQEVDFWRASWVASLNVHQNVIAGIARGNLNYFDERARLVAGDRLEEFEQRYLLDDRSVA